jgi:hypothetical protein
MRQIYHVFATVMLAPLSTAANSAVECKAELPAARTEYWSWRNIDGKQCWYPGRPGMDKANLKWPRAARPPAPIERASDKALAESHSANREEMSFEQRWPR